tara:strand:- start:819 stop:1265 length:447 start_codon:yes stop_codon:yes gene_type:complete
MLPRFPRNRTNARYSGVEKIRVEKGDRKAKNWLPRKLKGVLPSRIKRAGVVICLPTTNRATLVASSWSFCENEASGDSMAKAWLHHSLSRLITEVLLDKCHHLLIVSNASKIDASKRIQSMGLGEWAEEYAILGNHNPLETVPFHLFS